MKKYSRLIAVLAVLALAMSACTSSANDTTSTPQDSEPVAASQASEPAQEEGDGQSYSYFVNPKSIGPVYWEAARAGTEKVAEDLGVEVIFNAPTEADSAKQINMIDDMLTRQVNGIAVSPNDAQAVASIFTQAKGEGVQVVTWDSDAPDTDRTY